MNEEIKDAAAEREREMDRVNDPQKLLSVEEQLYQLRARVNQLENKGSKKLT